MLDEIRHAKLRNWIHEIAQHCTPLRLYLCNGSVEEFQEIAEEMCKKGKLERLNEKLRPRSFLARSHPDDVARVESRTFICSKKQEDAGPTNNWRGPEKMKKDLLGLFKGCMAGRTLYVIPFCMGPPGSPLSRIGVELTDSPYVVLNMSLMTRMGREILDLLEEDKPFVPCLHSVGVPLKMGEKDVAWPCNPERTVIAHFPETKEIWSFGSGYGGNALLGKKSLALRIASVMGREEGWLAEHMLIVGITNPAGEKKYFAAAFPSACGKTNLAMMQPTLPGWKVEIIGDDIAWMRFDKKGQLRAVNPEAGLFGVAPGTSLQNNPHAMKTVACDTIFTNVALTKEGDVWWEKMTKEPPEGLISWRGELYDPRGSAVAAHPNSRFTVSIKKCPILDPKWDDPEGVPISALIFGGRRAERVPLVMESFDWNHGVFLGASISSEMTAAAVGEIGALRHDPFAMLPFCGYNMGDYFAHWLSFQKQGKIPKIFTVNWFRKDREGNFLWPGFGDNIRVLKWIFERVEGKTQAMKTPLGYFPSPGAIDITNLSLTQRQMATLFMIDVAEWKKEMEEMRTYLLSFGKRLPQEMISQLEKVVAGLCNPTSASSS